MQATQEDPGKGFAGQPDPAEIRRELTIILESGSFRAAKRCHDFLGYVVTKALEGDVQNLKERTLAVEVFGRKVDADLGEDSIVRVGAREVRKRLAQYYMNEGTNDAVRIELPAGSYVPTFHWHTGAQELPPPPAAGALPAVPEPSPIRARSKARWLTAAAAILAIAAGVAGWSLWPRGAEEFETFWRPAFDLQSPVFVALAHPLVYHPSTRITELNEKKNGPAALPVQRPIQLPPELVNGADYVPVFDQYVGFGDTVAVARLSVLFAQRSRPVRLRLASRLDFADIRDSAAVLIGAYTNRWTMEITQALRYRFAISEGKPCIVDSQSGKHWKLTGKSDNGQAAEDYILIGRLVHAETGGFVVIAAGLTQYGTEDAGRILTEAASLVPVLRKLPQGWRNRNLELVLHAQVVGETPTAPELIAAHTW